MLKLCIQLTILGFCLIFSIAAPAEDSFSNIYVFGDSLSDSGNLASLPDFAFLNDPNLPYDNGFSNGPRAVQVLAGELGLMADPSLHLVGPVAGSNFAVAGARARGSADIDLRAQVDAFRLSTDGTAPLDALYIIFIGGNDIRDARDATSRRASKRIIRNAAAAIDDSIRKLIAAGARSIQVINSADVGSIPETRALAEANTDPRIIFRANLQTRFFNRLLAHRISLVEKALGLDIGEFDLFRFFAAVKADASALGFANTGDACFSSVTLTFNADCEFGDNFDEFVYFDDIHPTARAHERTGQAIFALVPEPVSQ